MNNSSFIENKERSRLGRRKERMKNKTMIPRKGTKTLETIKVGCRIIL